MVSVANKTARMDPARDVGFWALGANVVGKTLVEYVAGGTIEKPACVPAAQHSAKVIGMAQYPAGDGRPTAVTIGKAVVLVASGSLSSGDQVAVGATPDKVEAVSTNPACGRVLSDAEDGDPVLVLLYVN